MTATCNHFEHIKAVTPSEASGGDSCEDCLPIGGRWMHLRICLTCGHVGCCDSSPNRHATKHFHLEQHPLVASFEHSEAWGWCYIDEVDFDTPRPFRN